MKTKDIFRDKQIIKNLTNISFPKISLKNQNNIYLNLHRFDTFRLVLYFFSMTGRPDRALPKNWNKINGASGCTLQNCKFRDKYDEFISQNALPIGISTQPVEDLKEMTQRLNISFDILSDIDLKLTKKLELPTFRIENNVYIKRLTLIVEKNTIRKIFFPIIYTNKHIDEVIEWLKTN